MLWQIVMLKAKKLFFRCLGSQCLIAQHKVPYSSSIPPIQLIYEAFLLIWASLFVFIIIIKYLSNKNIWKKINQIPTKSCLFFKLFINYFLVFRFCYKYPISRQELSRYIKPDSCSSQPICLCHHSFKALLLNLSVFYTRPDGWEIVACSLLIESVRN